MSESGNTTEQNEAVAESAEAGQSEENTGVEPPRRRRGMLTAWFALLIALAALALASRGFWMPEPETQPRTERLAELERQIDRLSERLPRIEQALSEVNDELHAAIDSLPAPVEIPALQARLESQLDERLESRLQSLAGRVEQQAGQHNSELGALRGRLDSLESEFSSGLERLSARLEQADRHSELSARELTERLRLIEIAQLLAMADNAIGISGDRTAAEAALERIVRRSSTIDAPGWQRLHEAAQHDLNAVRDWSPAAGADDIRSLLSTAQAVASWPVGPVTDPQSPHEPEQSGWRERFGRIFGELVRVETLDPQQLSPVELDRARQRVQLLLEAGALALARREHAIANELIGQARNAIEQLFEPGHRQVESALTMLDALAQSLADPAPLPLPERTRVAYQRLGGQQ